MTGDWLVGGGFGGNTARHEMKLADPVYVSSGPPLQDPDEMERYIEDRVQQGLEPCRETLRFFVTGAVFREQMMAATDMDKDNHLPVQELAPPPSTGGYL